MKQNVHDMQPKFAKQTVVFQNDVDYMSNNFIFDDDEPTKRLQHAQNINWKKINNKAGKIINTNMETMKKNKQTTEKKNYEKAPTCANRKAHQYVHTQQHNVSGAAAATIQSSSSGKTPVHTQKTWTRESDFDVIAKRQWSNP